MRDGWSGVPTLFYNDYSWYERIACTILDPSSDLELTGANAVKFQDQDCVYPDPQLASASRVDTPAN